MLSPEANYAEDHTKDSFGAKSNFSDNEAHFVKIPFPFFSLLVEVPCIICNIQKRCQWRHLLSKPRLRCLVFMLQHDVPNWAVTATIPATKCRKV